MGRFTRKKKSERVKEILDAGIDVFGRKGFRNTTMEDIIEKTSLSKGGFYHYFKSTDEIMLAIMESETDIAYAMFLDELSGLGRDELISAVARAMIDRILRQNPSKKLFIMFFFEMIYKPEFLDKYLVLEHETLWSGPAEESSALFLKQIAKDERVIFLTRLNTVMILFFHIFPGKKMMEKYLFYIEDLFVRILEDITADLESKNES